MSLHELRTNRRAQVGAAVVAVVLVLLAVAVATTRSAGDVEVGRTSSSDRFAAWRWKLDTTHVRYTVHRDGNESVLSVSSAVADSAKVELASSGAVGGTAGPKCPKPAMLSGDAEQTEHDSCELEHAVHEQVTTTAGVLEAVIALRQNEDDDFLAASNHITVSINLYADPHARRAIDASGLAHAVARTTGDGDLQDILIRVRGTGTIWPIPAGRETSAGASGAPCTTGSATAANVDARNRFETCRAEQLRRLVAPMVGGASHAHVAVSVVLSAGERHEVRHEVQGGVLTQSTASATDTATSSANQTSRTIVPSTTDVESSRPRGVVERETVSVVLDGASPAQEQAVRTLLRGAILPAPHGDLTVVSLATPTTTAATNRAGAAPATSTTAPAPTTTGATTDASTSTTDTDARTAPPSSADARAARRRAVARIELLAAALVVVALLTGALQWRRAQLARRQRAAWNEAAFAHEQQAFQQALVSDPAQLAREIELILGPPAARGAHYVRTPDAPPPAPPGSPITAQASWTAPASHHPQQRDARLPA